MRFLKHIPENFEDLDIGDSDDITVEDLQQIDRQLEAFRLELVVFENGSAYNWLIQMRRNYD